MATSSSLSPKHMNPALYGLGALYAVAVTELESKSKSERVALQHLQKSNSRIESLKIKKAKLNKKKSIIDHKLAKTAKSLRKEKQRKKRYRNEVTNSLLFTAETPQQSKRQRTPNSEASSSSQREPVLPTEERLHTMSVERLDTWHEWALDRHPTFAVRCTEIAAERGYAKAEFEIGRYYKEGINGYEKSVVNAFEWNDRAAQKKYPPALCQLALYYAKGDVVTQDPAKAISLLQESACLNDIKSMLSLGMIYKNGVVGINQNYSLAFYWLTMAAQAGDSEAQYEVACFHLHGVGSTEINVKEAVKWFKKAGDQGHPEAQFQVALSYMSGCDGILNKSLACAATWFRKASARGHSQAQYYLADFHIKGIGGTKKCDILAAALLSRAGNSGHAMAQYLLGVFFQSGRGNLPVDTEMAKEWFMLSAEQGHQPAIDALDEIL